MAKKRVKRKSKGGRNPSEGDKDAKVKKLIRLANSGKRKKKVVKKKGFFSFLKKD